MTTLILYGSPVKLTAAHKPVWWRTVEAKDGGYGYFVRAELFHGGMELALVKATPQEGETVLNTVEVP